MTTYYPIVIETEASGAVSAYVPGLPVFDRYNMASGSTRLRPTRLRRMRMARALRSVVTGSDGEGSAVLLRAVEPVEGIESMRARRGVSDPLLLCAGPARLTQAYGIGRADNGMDLVHGGSLWVAAGRRVPSARVGTGPRVGISSARERPWRFFELGSPFVSKGPRPAGAISGGRAGRR